MVFLIVMGPCGSGKSHIGMELAKFYNCSFIDADDLHSVESVSKMQNGIPLTDEDRIPWLIRLREAMLNIKIKDNPSDKEEDKKKIEGIAACSALKIMYRNTIRNGSSSSVPDGNSNFIFIVLNCSKEVLEQRLAKREGHFMKTQMLDSQLAILELPKSDENDAVIINGNLQPDEILGEIKKKLIVFL